VVVLLMYHAADSSPEIDCPTTHIGFHAIV
jgi:hypothetical protein